MKLAFNYFCAKEGDQVWVKRNPNCVLGLKGFGGKITRKWPKEIGFTVKFRKPLKIQIKGCSPQRVDSFTLRTSYFSY